MSLHVNDPHFHQQWGLRRVRFPEAWALAEGRIKERPRVAIVDTGVAFHEDLPTPAFYHGFGEAAATDLHGHGTAVAGILCASTNNGMGIAGAVECDLFVYRVTDEKGWRPRAYYSALRRLPADGIRVVNLSEGGRSRDATEEMLLSRCVAAGIIVVAAAGNHGQQGNPTIYPAALDGIIAVSAVEDRDRLAFRSSSGPYVFVAAPGDSMSTSLHNSYRTVSGTSFAAPLVTAAIALALSIRPEASADVIRNLLRATAQDVTGHGRTNELGYGILDAGEFIRQVLNIR